jgi:hypothetical protein
MKVTWTPVLSLFEGVMNTGTQPIWRWHEHRYSAYMKVTRTPVLSLYEGDMNTGTQPMWRWHEHRYSACMKVTRTPVLSLYGGDTNTGTQPIWRWQEHRYSPYSKVTRTPVLSLYEGDKKRLTSITSPLPPCSNIYFLRRITKILMSCKLFTCYMAVLAQCPDFVPSSKRVKSHPSLFFTLIQFNACNWSYILHA